MPELQPVVMENIQIVFRNFEGKEDQYNRAGDRNFAVILPEEVATAMRRDGWNVKQLKQRDEDIQGDFYLEVAVGYKVRPPQVWLITSRGRTALGEAEVAMLDYVDIKNIDIILNPYPWNVNGNKGIKAYLGSAFVTIDENPLELKYADVPISHG